MVVGVVDPLDGNGASTVVVVIVLTAGVVKEVGIIVNGGGLVDKIVASEVKEEDSGGDEPKKSDVDVVMDEVREGFEGAIYARNVVGEIVDAIALVDDNVVAAGSTVVVDDDVGVTRVIIDDSRDDVLTMLVTVLVMRAVFGGNDCDWLVSVIFNVLGDVINWVVDLYVGDLGVVNSVDVTKPAGLLLIIELLIDEGSFVALLDAAEKL